MIYTGENRREISFPLGGIGTGCIGLAGDGSFVDWEIFNRPAKGTRNGRTHIAVKAVSGSERIVKVLQADLQRDFSGSFGKHEHTLDGFGFGADVNNMSGFPHFRDLTFRGEFPVAQLTFDEPDFPAKIILTALSPMIPLDSENSSLPVIFLKITFQNKTDKNWRYTAAFSLRNPYSEPKNRAVDIAGKPGVFLMNYGALPDGLKKPEDASRPGEEAQVAPGDGETRITDPTYGDLTLVCDAPECDVQEYWYRGDWEESIITFWNEFCESDTPVARRYDAPCRRHDTCTIYGSTSPAPGQSGDVGFTLSWSTPLQYNYWNPYKDKDGNDITWKNYYATRFADSRDSARYAIEHGAELWDKTIEFRDTLFDSTLDPAVTDAVSANLAVLRSPTVMRLEDGSIYGWEGVAQSVGSCEGSCAHVWNYAFALCFLFPDLERSLRDIEFRYSVMPDGAMNFRMPLPAGRPPEKIRICLDGQMGTVLKTFREWRLSGDTDWLRGHWDDVRKVLEYAWSPDNPHGWDADRDGTLEGRQHNTLDMELFGPSGWLQGMYLAALKAASIMADALGYEDESAEYNGLFERGRRGTAEELFNGRWFIQKIDLKDKSVTEKFGCPKYWHEEKGELKYQIGDGCEIDQLLGQWFADLLMLGDVFDPKQINTALENIYANNFKRNMRNIANPWRVFALNDESGVIICDYPDGTYKPAVPITYAEEIFDGAAYALAGLLCSRGFTEEGLTIVRSVRSRYDGSNRNPWNELECGSNYARNMASFALLPLLSGLRFAVDRDTALFEPKYETLTAFWCVCSGWGLVKRNGKHVAFTVKEGKFPVHRIVLPFADGIESVKIDGRDVTVSRNGGKELVLPDIPAREEIFITVR